MLHVWNVLTPDERDYVHSKDRYKSQTTHETMQQLNPEQALKVEKPEARKWLSWPMLAGLAGIILAAAYSGIVKFSAQTIDSTNYSLRTENILSTTPLIDGHNDLPYLLRLELQNQIYDNTTFTFRDGKLQHALTIQVLPMILRLHRTC